MINPEYEGRKYNYAYGQAIVEFERQYLIKKDIADSANDKVHIIPRLNIVSDNHLCQMYLINLFFVIWSK